MRTLIILLALLIPADTTEKVIQRNVQFRVNEDHTFTPLLPMKLTVEQEQGGLADGITTCTTVQRIVEDRHYAIFSCEGGKVFRFAGMSFTPSH